MKRNFVIGFLLMALSAVSIGVVHDNIQTYAEEDSPEEELSQEEVEGNFTWEEQEDGMEIAVYNDSEILDEAVNEVEEDTSVMQDAGELDSHEGKWIALEHAEGTYIYAMVENDTITVRRHLEDGDEELIWQGSYEAPDDETGTYSWISVKASSTMDDMVYQNETKEFTYDDGILSFDISSERYDSHVELGMEK